MPDLSRFTPPPGWEGADSFDPVTLRIPAGKLTTVRWCMLRAIETALQEDTVGTWADDSGATELVFQFRDAADQQRPAAA